VRPAFRELSGGGDASLLGWTHRELAGECGVAVSGRSMCMQGDEVTAGGDAGLAKARLEALKVTTIIEE